MNIFEKLQSVRVSLAALEIKKGGENKFAGYKYFELSDFLPEVQRLFNTAKLCGIVTFTKETANLTVINIEKPDEVILFTSPMSEATLKGAHPIQNLGAVETYQRRYLYMAALEITEPDAIDASEPSKEQTKPAEKKDEDNRPWLSDKQTDQAVARIINGEAGVKEKIYKAFKVSKANRAKIEAAMSQDADLLESEEVSNEIPF